jgi:DNA-directed RNA polymerase subunit beta'
MGHITLTVPVVHIWYFKSLPNKIAYLLGLSSKNLERIVYYETFVVVNPGLAKDLGYKKGDLISEEENLIYWLSCRKITLNWKMMMKINSS